MVQVGALCALDGFNLLHGGADRGEGGVETVEGLDERGARVDEREGNELYSSPLLLEGRDEGGVLFQVLWFVVAEVSA